MPIKDLLLAEYDHEMGVTRRLLERLPEQEFAWKPHERSMSLGGLAAHLANLPTWTKSILERADFDLTEAAAMPRPAVLATTRELLDRFAGNVADARGRLEAAAEAQFSASWTLKNNGHIVFAMPRVAALRRFLMNHAVHHRGQLSVYLRLKNVPLPAMYGPTADEG